MEFLISRRTFRGKPYDFSNAPSVTANYLAAILPRRNNPATGVPITQNEWVNKVIPTCKHGRLLIIVHGYNVQQRSFLDQISKIRKTIGLAGFEGGVVGFDWPSDGNFLRYWTDRKDAEHTASSLVDDCIVPLLRRKPDLQISILSHSMGTFVVSRALQRAAAGKHLDDLRKAIKEVVFTSAEINRKHLKAGGWALNAFKQYDFRFTSYWSKADQVLRDREGWFRKPTRRFGRHKSTLKASKQHDAVDCTAYYQKAYAKKGSYRRSHSFYYEDRVFFADLVATITSASKKKRPFRKKTSSGYQALKA